MDPFSVENLNLPNANLTPESNLFNEIGFCVSGTVNPKLLKLLEHGGGKQRTYAGVGVTHFFAAQDADEIKVEEGKDIFEIPIVAPRWITYSVLLQKVLPLNGFNGEVNQLFTPVIATASGAKGMDLKNLWTNLTYHGGTFNKKLTDKCTHLITNICSGNKYKVAEEKGISIVTFDWLTESIAKGKIEDVKLYHPSLLVQPQQPVIKVVKTEAPAPVPTVQKEIQQRQPFSVAPRPTQTSAQHWTQQQQAEIIRQIQNDPQIKQQWGQMDHQQRTLLIQKLAQRNREDHLRREMMIRQQQMNLQNTNNQPRLQLNLNITPQVSTAVQIPQAGSQQVAGISLQSDKPNVSLPMTTNSKSPPTNCPPLQAKPGSQEQSILNNPLGDFENKPHNQINYSQLGVITTTQQSVHIQQPVSHLGVQSLRPVSRQILTTQGKQFTQIFTPTLTLNNQSQNEIGNTDQPGFKPQNSESVQRLAAPQQPSTGQLFPPQLVQQQSHESLPKQQDSPQVSQHSAVFHPPVDSEASSQPSQVTGSPQGEASVQSDKNLPSHPKLFPQRSPIPQLQQHKFFQTQGQELQLQKQPIGQITIAQQRQGGTEMIRAQQIFPPHFSQQNPQRINVRHVFVHQGDQPRLQQHIILQPTSQDGGHPQQKLTLLATQQTVPSTGPNAQWISSSIRQPREPNNSNQSPTAIQHARPLVSETSIAQQWTSPTRHPSQPPHASVIYTTSQHNLPFVQVVNSRTKTALANLLSNRLQGSTETATTMVPASSPQQGQCPVTPPIAQIHHSVSPPAVGVNCQPNLNDRRTLSNLSTSTNGKPQSITSPSHVQPQSLPVTTARAQFYGHDPNIKLPSDGFLLGCIFWAAQPLDNSEWEKCVEQYGGEVESSYCPRLTHVICTTQKFPEFHQAIREGKRLVTLHWLSDICVRKCVVSPFYALHLPVPVSGNDRPLEGDLLSITGFHGEDRVRVKVMCSILGATVCPFFTKLNVALVAQKAEGLKYQKAREWKTPVVNVQFLNELMFGQHISPQMIHSPKYQHFNLEQPFRCDIGLVSQLMAAWKVPIRVNGDSFEKYKYRKRTSDNKDESENAKRMRLFNADKELLNSYFKPAAELNSLDSEPRPNPAPVVVLSGFAPIYKEKLKENIEALGGKVTEDVNAATILVTKVGCRTKKLFMCLSKMSHIVATTWVYDSLAKGKYVDVGDYCIEDIHFEKCLGRKIEDIIKTPDRTSLFSGLTFFFTPSIDPSPGEMREIVEAAGGQVDLSQRSMKSIRVLASATKNYIIITCPADEHLILRDFDSKDAGKIEMFSTDSILASIIRQKPIFFDTDG